MKKMKLRGLFTTLFLAGSFISCGAQTLSALNIDNMFTDRDARQIPDFSRAVSPGIRQGEDTVISSEGIYLLSGRFEETSIIVDAGKEDKVQLILNNLSITNRDKPAVYIKRADKVFITSVNTNIFTVSGEIGDDGDTNLDAVIFSREDLVLNGTGSLNITSSRENAITSKDDLKITGSALTVKSAKDSLEANDSIRISGGDIFIDSGKDGLHSENEDDPDLGYIYISGGNLEIRAADDAIQGNSTVQIDGGEILITSSTEGIESTHVQINGGVIDLYASDDGINAASKNGRTPLMEINGGELTVEVGPGDTDGFDSNGDLIIRGGTIHVTAPRSPFDADGEVEFLEGSVFVNGQAVSEIPVQRWGRRR